MPSAATTAADLALNGGTPVFSKPVPFMALGLHESDIEAATEVLRSGMLRAASKCAEFEKRFATATDAKHALTCANGTCALQLAYEALLKPGDEVIVPAWTYIATASMLVARGCRPIFCDSLEDTYQIDVADAERRITPNTRAIACTHLYGIPVDIDAVERLAARHGLMVIYDAAQAHLATYRGKGIGAFGNAVTYSFYATKNLGTGEGGMVTTNAENTAYDMSLLRSHGETEKYLHERVGYNYRMNDITGAIGLSKLHRLPAETERRRAVADRYHRLFDQLAADGLPIGRPVPTEGTEPAWHLYSLRIEHERLTCSRDQFSEALKAEGVPSAVHYPKSLTRQPAFREHVTDHPPVADRLASRVLSIPIHHEITDEQADRVAEAVAKVARAYLA